MEVGRCPPAPLATLLNGRTRQYIGPRVCAYTYKIFARICNAWRDTLLQQGNPGVQKAADTDVNPHPEPKNLNFGEADDQPSFHEIVPSINAAVEDHNSFV